MWIFAIIGLLALLFGNTRFPMATAVYIVVMIGACIFNDRILIWIAATVVYCLYRKNN